MISGTTTLLDRQRVIANPNKVAAKRHCTIVYAARRPTLRQMDQGRDTRNPLDGVVRYVSEAFSSIFFGSSKSRVPWYSEPFSGRIHHHENSNVRYRSMHPEVMQGAPIPVPVEEPGSAAVRRQSSNFLVDSIGRIMGGNVDEDMSTEPRKFYSTGYAGKRYSQRRLRREYNKVSRRH